MNYAIDRQFSVYRLVERTQQQNVLLSQRRTMSYISYQIENASLIDGAKTRIFSAFQYMSRFLPQIERYRRLAQTAESIYVFGVPDVRPPQIENIRYVFVTPDDQIAREWFLVSYGARFASALATEEITRFNDPDHLRQFRGMWTFDPEMVAILHDWLSSAVDAPPMLIDRAPTLNDQEKLVQRAADRLSEVNANSRLSPPLRQEIAANLEVALASIGQ